MAATEKPLWPEDRRVMVELLDILRTRDDKALADAVEVFDGVAREWIRQAGAGSSNPDGLLDCAAILDALAEETLRTLAFRRGRAKLELDWLDTTLADSDS